MGDRREIADALNVALHNTIEPCPSGCTHRVTEDSDWTCLGMANVVARRLDAAGYDVVLRADPDTNDNTATEAQRLLNAATPGPWEKLFSGDGYHIATNVRRGSTGNPMAWTPVAQVQDFGDEEADYDADAALIAAAPRLIATLLAERDAERAARTTAEAEVERLRERIDAASRATAGPDRSHDEEMAAAVAGGAENREHTHTPTQENKHG